MYGTQVGIYNMILQATSSEVAVCFPGCTVLQIVHIPGAYWTGLANRFSGDVQSVLERQRRRCTGVGGRSLQY